MQTTPEQTDQATPEASPAQSAPMTRARRQLLSQEAQNDMFSLQSSTQDAQEGLRQSKNTASHEERSQEPAAKSVTRAPALSEPTQVQPAPEHLAPALTVAPQPMLLQPAEQSTQLAPALPEPEPRQVQPDQEHLAPALPEPEPLQPTAQSSRLTLALAEPLKAQEHLAPALLEPTLLQPAEQSTQLALAMPMQARAAHKHLAPALLEPMLKQPEEQSTHFTLALAEPTQLTQHMATQLTQPAQLAQLAPSGTQAWPASRHVARPAREPPDLPVDLAIASELPAGRAASKQQLHKLSRSAHPQGTICHAPR